MTHLEMLVNWFKRNHYQATLHQIITCGEPWSYEFRARATDLRKKGSAIDCVRGKRPSENLYTLREPAPVQEALIP